MEGDERKKWATTKKDVKVGSEFIARFYDFFNEIFFLACLLAHVSFLLSW
jgi:hypothetical protein